jgi:alkylation response protein AidB-like acyl-CoA dehydrogenase
MDFDLTDEQHTRRRELVAFAQETLSPGAAQREAERRFSRAHWNQAAARGLAGLPIPHAWGGSGLDALDTALAIEALGEGCEDGGLLFSLCAHTFACAVPLWHAGTPEQHDRWLRGIATGRRIAANAISEGDAGSDAFALRTTARLDGNRYIVNGAKCHVTNGPVADVFVVYARTEPAPGAMGVSALLIERETPGLDVEPGPAKTGLVTASWGTLHLTECPVPIANRLGEPGSGAAIFNDSMRWERVCLFAAFVGTMARTLTRSVQHVRERRQFGKPIGSFQSVANRVVDMHARLETSRLLLYRAAWLLREQRPCEVDIALAKLWISECAVQSGLDAVQLFGAAGVTPASGVDALLRDALPARIFSGTSEIQRALIARHLGLP